MKIFSTFSKGVFSLFFFTVVFTISITGQNKILFNGINPGIDISVLSSNSSSTVLEYNLTGLFENEMEINGKTYATLSVPKMISLKDKGFPELPTTRNSIIISDKEGIRVKILEQEFEYRNTLPIAPSKGHFTRDIDPKTVEYTFDDFYGENKWFPEKILTVDSPYIVRDFRGATVQFNPVQFNPRQNKLKIYTHLIVEIINDSEREAINPFDRKSYEISKGYSSVYKSLFLNYQEKSTEYSELPENGRLLIVYYQDYAAQVADYYNWKVNNGFNAILAEYPTDTGTGSSSLKTYIQNLYDEPESLMFIVLIGEDDEVPTLNGDYEGAPSDPCYVKLAGDDAYPDAYISRISVTSPDNCEYVLNKIMNYGASTKADNDWLLKGMGVASDQGTPPDWQRADSLRVMLLDNMHFTLVDQIYDPTGTANDVTTALNEGRSVINYIGHGSGVNWSTTGFGVSNINNLSNGYKLPFIIDVACLNGDFTLDECMEEAWIRAGDLDDPKGAIAVYGSSTNASWVPPCDMQNHAVELMTTYEKITVGGVCFNGLMYAMDLWGGSSGEGLKLMEQYNIFGDCSTYLIFGATPDDVPPTTITDLSVTDIGSNSYRLTWTAPSDTSINGVTAYDLRKSSFPINTENDFYAAEQVSCGVPSPPGSSETLLIDNLPCSDVKYYAIKAMDIWGNASDMSNVVTAETYGPPEISVTPTQIDYPAVEVGSVFTDNIQITNASANLSTLDYTVSLENNTFPMSVVGAHISANKNQSFNKEADVKGNKISHYGQRIDGAGGPDNGGYVWRDSNDPNGPVYEWTDISITGTLMNFPNGNQDDGWTNAINLGFSFNFYGNNYSSVRFSSNGIILFESLSSSYRTNNEIPSDGSPNTFIAPFWDDLTGSEQGEYYYQQDGDRFIIQFNDIQKYYSAAFGGPSGHYTFQVVLESNGKIKIYYKEMIGAIDEATVGIENEDGTIGTQVTYNASYPPSNEFALQFMQEPDWVVANDLGGGRIFNSNSANVELSFDATDLSEGDYSMDLVITSNAPDKSVITVPITMTVFDPTPVELISFSAQEKNGKIELRWKTATETNNKGFDIQRSADNGQHSVWETIGFVDGQGTTSEPAVYRFEDIVKNKSNRKIFYRLKQIDFGGTFSYSKVVEVETLPLTFSLGQNYPNPFSKGASGNASTKIEFSLPEKSDVVLSVYNSLGEKVASLVNETKESGYYSIEWNAGNLPSGIYIYRIEVNSSVGGTKYTDVKKMLLLK